MARLSLQQRRERQRQFAPGSLCFAKQGAFVTACVSGAARNIVCLAGRQSGKSFAGVMAALLLGLVNAGSNIIYVTSTYSTCKKMAFKPACELARTYCLGGKTNDSEQSITLPNGSTIYFLGADRETTVQRLRGTPKLIACFVDEAGVYSSDTLKTILETVRPGLRPYAGKLILLGTPSLQGRQGTWYEATENGEYDQHRFGYADNDRVPSFADVEKIIDEDLRAQGVTRESAYFRREYLALFEVDLAERVYAVAEANYYDGPPPDDLTSFVVGGDLGVTANDALITLGWRDDDPAVYVVEESQASGQDSLAFASMVKDVWDRRQPLVIAVDPGGLGQKTIRTVQTLFPTVPIVEAIKPPIVIQVKATNALLQAGRLLIPRGSKLAQELARPTWEGGMVGAAIQEHGQHSDLAPCLRYAVLAATPMLPEVDTITPEAIAKARQEEERLARMRKAQGYRQPANDNAEDDWDEDAEAWG